MTICKLQDFPNPPAAWDRIEEIFFLSSSRQGFESVEERSAFFESWTGYYREAEPENTLLSLSTQGEIEGYLTGCLDSASAQRLYKDIAYYALFEDLFDAYPAHLHINFHPKARSQGKGQRLVEAFIKLCLATDRAGLHVVTAPDARNAGFYRHLGFDQEEVRPWRERQLLFLGRKLR